MNNVYAQTFKVGDQFVYLGVKMLVVETDVLNRMTVHYVSDNGLIEKFMFHPEHYPAVVAHLKDTKEFNDGLIKAYEENQ